MRQNQLRKSSESIRKMIGAHARLKLIGFLIAGVLISCSALTFVSRARTLPAPERPAAASAISQSIKPGSREPVEVVRFALYDVGIYPQEAHVGKGVVAISFEDMSGGASELVVERDTGAALQGVGRAARADSSPRGRADLKLEAGRYRVYMADRPDNQATLIVEP